jgi:hypothetical protein
VLSERKKIVILTVGNYSWTELYEGQEQFLRDQCPVNDCWITRDRIKYRETADALLMQVMNADDIKNYKPKPASQVRM